MSLPLPHRYVARATAHADGDVILHSRGLPDLRSALPAEFGGTGQRWSPETLLTASLADCVVLTFRGLARRALFSFLDVECEVTGTLDRLDRVTAFTRFQVRIVLRIAEGASEADAERLLHQAETTCLISNSLTASTDLVLEVRVEPATTLALAGQSGSAR